MKSIHPRAALNNGLIVRIFPGSTRPVQKIACTPPASLYFSTCNLHFCILQADLPR